jgi:hypothetical protein
LLPKDSPADKRPGNRSRSPSHTLAELPNLLASGEIATFLQKTGFVHGPTTLPCKKIFDFSSICIYLQAFNSKYRSIFINSRNIHGL